MSIEPQSMSDFIIEGSILKTYIGKDSFLRIPEGVTEIESDAFDKDPFIEKISIPSTLKSLNWRIYQNWKKLKEVHIVDLSAWCNMEFSSYFSNPLYYAHNLYLNGKLVEQLVIPEGVTTIRAGVFAGCNSITSITLPNSVTAIRQCAFAECCNIKRICIGNIANWLNIEFSDRRANPMRMDSRLCIDGQIVSEIIIPDCVARIKPYAFAGYRGFSSLTIPNSVKSIGNDAFINCAALKKISIPNSVTEIESSAFAGCSSLTDIHIPHSVRTIAPYTFASCDALAVVDIPPSVTSIENGAFIECGSLERIAIPDSVTHIGDYAFEECRSLTEISIPDGTTHIGKQAFKKCKALTSIALPDSVTEIDREAFIGCASLEKIHIPPYLSSVGNDAFKNCDTLKQVHITDIASWCSIVFYNYASNPLHCAHNLYFDGKLLTHLDIPDSVTCLKAYCFYGCSSLMRIAVPNSVSRIEDYAFHHCTSLKEVHISNLATWCNISFDGVSSNPLSLGATLYLNGSPAPVNEINLHMQNNIPKYQAAYGIKIIASVDAYYHNYDLTETIDFNLEDVVIENGALAGFRFHGTFIKISDLGQELEPSFIPATLLGSVGHVYATKMKLYKK